VSDQSIDAAVSRARADDEAHRRDRESRAAYKRTRDAWMAERDRADRLQEQVSTARGLLERSHVLTKADYRKSRGSVVQPLCDEIKD